MTYALITGASKGIGKAIALELARRKHPVLLIARSADLLKSVAQEITEKSGVKVDYLAIDLSSATAAHEVYNWCLTKNYTIDILINNAGYGLSGMFEKYSLEQNLNMMQVNMITCVSLCQLFLPMLKKQKKAHILNVASSAAYQAVPGLSLYAATKVFLLNFSRGLKQELINSTVSVSCICPGPTDTDFSMRANVGPTALKAGERLNMTPEKVAQIAIDGMFKQKREVVPGVINKLNVVAAWLLPKILLERVAMGLYKEE